MNYLIKTVATLTMAVIIANLIAEYGLTRLLVRFLNPLIKFSHLSKEVITSSLMRLLSPTVGYSTLAEFYRRGKVSDKEVIVTTFVTTFPYEFLRLPYYYIPLVVGLLGASLGLKYLLIKLTSSFFQSFLAIIYSKLKFPPQQIEPIFESEEKGDYKTALLKSMDILKRVIPTFLVAVSVIKLLRYFGVLDKISLAAGPITGAIGLPGESAIVMVTQFANVIAGFAVCGELVSNGVLSENIALVTLILGLTISLPRIYLQHTFPTVTALFTKKLALKIIALKIAVEAALLLVILGVLYSINFF